MDRFENMKAFIQVVETGNISSAAIRMEVAKSTVSKRLKELEEHLDVQLFHRTTRRMNLTDTGNAFYEQAVRILDDVLEAENAVTQVHGSLKGGLKVAIPYSFGTMHLSSAINDFLQLHPQIEFDLEFNDRQVDIIQEGFDLAIRLAKLPDSSLIARRLATIKHVVCASPDYLAKNGHPQKPDDLQNHQCIAYNLIPDYKTWIFFNKDNEECNVSVQPYIKSNAGYSLCDSTVAGHGICYMPTFLAYNEIEQGRLVPVLKEYTLRQVNAYAVYPQTRHLSQRVRVFIDFLVKRFEGRPYWDLCLNNN